jgi:hypothetical protein
VRIAAIRRLHRAQTATSNEPPFLEIADADVRPQLAASALPVTRDYDKPNSPTDHHDRLTAFYTYSAPKPKDCNRKPIGQNEKFKVLGPLLWSRDRPVPRDAFERKEAPARSYARTGLFQRKTMSTNELSGEESGESTDERRSSEAVAKRVSRALDGFYHVEAAGDNGEYAIFSGSGNTYTVNLPEGTCTCPDGQRSAWCKHAHRAAFVTGEIPAIDGVHVETDDAPDAEANGEESDDEPDTDDETLAERVERFEQNNPGASAIEVVARLDIDPGQKEHVEEVLA